MSELIQWASGEDDKSLNAIAEVRKDGSSSDWVTITFASNGKDLKLGAIGGGGIEALKQEFKDDQIHFALLRVKDKIDESVTTKFVWINWLGEKVGRMQKARLSVQLGSISDFMGQRHVDFTVNAQHELTEAIVMEKVMVTSGSGSKVLDSAGVAQATNQAKNKIGASTGTKVSNDVISFDDSAAAAIAEVRNDDIPTTWCLSTYDGNSAHVVFLAKGTGDVKECASHLKDDHVCYGLIRKLEKIDDTVAVKFCYLRWIGNNIPRMLKAKLGTHAGAASSFFLPHHVSLNSPDLAEVNDDYVMKLIMVASGTAQHTLSDNDSRAIKTQPIVKGSSYTNVNKPKPTSGVQTHGGVVTVVDSIISLENEDAIRDAIKSVRRDDGPDWVLVTYTAAKSKTLKLQGTGNGGLAELKTFLNETVVMYGLLRTTLKIDDSITTKFTFINWVGPQINRMQRAQLGTHSGAVLDIFRPFHVDVPCSESGEITDEIVNQKIKNASGTAIHVL